MTLYNTLEMDSADGEVAGKVILVTGAAGKTGRALIGALTADGFRVRAFTRRQEQGKVVRRAGAGEWLAGDLLNRHDVLRALEGVDGIYHIPPNVSPDEAAIGQVVIEAAREMGMTRFVYHSVLHPQIEAMPHHWAKMRVEEALFASGLPFTVLQPAAYMQNILAAREGILREGRYKAPYGPGTKLALVDLLDVAAAGVKVMSSDDHIGATYELVGPDIYTQTELAAILSQVADRPVSFERVNLDEWEEKARARGLGAYQIDALLKMFLYYDHYGLEGGGRTLEWLLGRRPVDFESFCRREFGH